MQRMMAVFVAGMAALLGCPSSDSVDGAASNASISSTAVDVEALPSAFRAIRETPGELERAGRLVDLISTLGPEAGPALAYEVRTRSVSWRGLDRMILLAAWTRVEPRTAARWAISGSPKGYREIAIEIAITGWARQDPAAALELYGDSAGTVLEGLISGWFESGQPGLEDFMLDQQLEGIEGQRAYSVYLRRRIERDGIEDMISWVEEMTTTGPLNFPRTRRHLYRRAGAELAKVSPDAAIEFCDRHCAGTDGEGVRQVIATMITHSDGRKAMEWLRSSTEADETERKRAANVAFMTWSGVSRKDAWDWALSLPVETRTEQWLSGVVRRLTSRMGWKKSLVALEWAGAIPNEAERERAQVRILQRWRANDEASAEAWLESSSLSEEAREQVRAASDS